MKLPQYISSSIQNTKYNTIQHNHDSSSLTKGIFNNTSSTKDKTRQSEYNQTISQCVEKLIPNLQGIFSTEQSLQNAKNYIKHLRCANNSSSSSSNFNLVKPYKQNKMLKQYATENSTPVLTSKNTATKKPKKNNLHSMCQLDFEGFNNKPKNVVDIIPFKKEYLNDNSNIVNNKENKYKVLSNVNNLTKNKSGVLLKKLNIPENKCNDIDKETIDSNDYPSSSRYKSPQYLTRCNSSGTNNIIKKFKKNIETTANIDNYNTNYEVMRSPSSPLNVNLFNGIVLTIVKDGVSIRNYKCENALMELNKQLKEDKINVNGIPLQFEINNKEKEIECKNIRSKGKLYIESLQSIEIVPVKLHIKNIHTIQKNITLEFEAFKTFDQHSLLNKITPVNSMMGSAVMSSKKKYSRRNNDLDRSFSMNTKENDGKINNNTVYSKPLSKNRGVNCSKVNNKSPMKNGVNIKLRKPKIIVFDNPPNKTKRDELNNSQMLK